MLNGQFGHLCFLEWVPIVVATFALCTDTSTGTQTFFFFFLEPHLIVSQKS